MSVAGAAKKKVAATSSNKELKVELEKSLKNELYEDAFTKVRPWRYTPPTLSNY